MKVALIGYGKMGKTIEELLIKRGHSIVAKFDRKGLNKTELTQADIAIEFTHPTSAYKNITTCLECGIPVVTGTTGWLGKYDEVLELCKAKKGAMIYASNFSLGVNIFFELNERLAEVMNDYSDYEVSLEEIHHTEKKDAPSGTAITLAEQIEKKIDRKESWTMDSSPAKSQIYVKADRVKNIPGTHSVSYQSEIDTIEIKHIAHNRQGFALGAVLAAEHLNGKTGIYTMKDVLNL
jgi:4-hydroxy-tetrahydrodipicolinate reductase